MRNKLAGLIGVAALAALGTTPVASAPLSERLLQASSFTELLQPIPNAQVLLAAAEGAGESPGAGGAEGREMMAYYHHHHHHHHHYGWGRHRYHHHHHHHHHHYYRY